MLSSQYRFRGRPFPGKFGYEPSVTWSCSWSLLVGEPTIRLQPSHLRQGSLTRRWTSHIHRGEGAGEGRLRDRPPAGWQGTTVHATQRCPRRCHGPDARLPETVPWAVTAPSAGPASPRCRKLQAQTPTFVSSSPRAHQVTVPCLFLTILPQHPSNKRSFSGFILNPRWQGFLKMRRNLYQVSSFAIYMQNPPSNLHNHFQSKTKMKEINISLWEKSFQLEEFCKWLHMSKYWIYNYSGPGWGNSCLPCKPGLVPQTSNARTNPETSTITKKKKKCSFKLTEHWASHRFC